LHKYLLTYLFSMYYETIIFLLWILYIHKLCQNLWKLNFHFLSQVYFIKLFTLKKSYFNKMKVFSKVLNTHLYIKQNETKYFFKKI
jgi:hypothetical protein